MNSLTVEALQRLMEERREPCVSLFMKIQKASRETRQNPPRFKNLLRKAEEQLIAHGVDNDEVGRILAPAKALIDDTLYWNMPGEGLAMFLSRDGLQDFHLPIAPEEMVVVAPRFHVKPVLPLLDQSERFMILALSQKHLQLYDATPFGMTQVPMKNVPTDMQSALQYDDTGKRRQFRGETGAGAAQRPGSFHGQGVGTDATEHKKDILRYFQIIDRSLQENILARSRPPLVIAASEYLVPIYREASTYENLVEQGIMQNPDGLDERTLHQKAAEIMRGRKERRKRQAIEQFNTLFGTGRASADLNEIAGAAYGGRVLVLFVPIGVHRWGKFDVSTSSVTTHDRSEAGDVDLLDFCATQALQHDGTVYALKAEEIPGGREVAAVFRY